MTSRRATLVVELRNQQAAEIWHCRPALMTSTRPTEASRVDRILHDQTYCLKDQDVLGDSGYSGSGTASSADGRVHCHRASVFPTVPGTAGP